MATSDEKLFRVDGLVAVVTGAGTGLGRIMAQALAANGAEKIYIIGRRLEKLQETAEGRPNIIPIQGDVTDKESLAAAANKIRGEVGYVNMVIVNTGYFGPPAQKAALEGSISEMQQFLWACSQEEMTRTYEVNNVASFFTAVAFLELLDAGNKRENCPGIHSQIIFTTSIAGFTRVLNTGVAYIPSKAASNHMTKMFATTLARWQIRVNGISPGIYRSEMTETLLGSDAIKTMGQTVPLGRIGSEEDMKGLVLFLASRAGSYINGEILLTDGGRLTQVPSTY